MNTPNYMTQRLSCDPDGINRAAALLRAGDTVAFPTETVFGLGADACNDRAVKGIYAAKGRPSNNPLIAHVATAKQAERYVKMTPLARDLAQHFWPGALTLVLPLCDDAQIAPTVTAGHNTLAIRVPDHPLAQALLQAFDGPVAAPSANLSGRISPTSPDHVLAGLDGKIGGVFMAPPCAVGVESTIVDFPQEGGVRILRPGGVTADQIAQVTGIDPRIMEGSDDITPNSPGQLTSHYAPKVAIRLNADAPMAGEQYLGFGGCGAATINLSPTGDLKEAARNLFDALHQLDANGHPIAVAPIPDRGIGRAINDRLKRAAAPRG